MVRLQEILNTENNRKENNDLTSIHLWREGSFYRMYNWSAWLIIAYCYNEQLIKDNYKPLTVTRKYVAGTEDTLCFVGFPLKSLQKFIPNAVGFEPNDNNHITIPITLPAQKIDFETLDLQYQQWFNQLPISEEKPKKSSEKKDYPIQQSGLTKVMLRILQYPVEQRSLIENTEFISRIKQELATIF